MAVDRDLVVPPELVASQLHYFGDAGRRWVAALPALAAERCARWGLRRDGEPAYGAVALVLPVVRADGTPAALKLQPVDDETRDEAAALRCWAGLGAVGLLEHDPASGSLLLERLEAERSLLGVPDDLEALAVIAGLLRRLTAVPAPGGLRRLDDIAAAMLVDAGRVLPTVADRDDAALLRRCGGRLGEVLAEPVGDRLLHWDLHYANVLAAHGPDQAHRWRAIDPKPLAGDPGFELLPALWNRWDDLVARGDVARGVRRRFDLMVDVLELDRVRATTWTLARVLQDALWDLGRLDVGSMKPGHRAIAAALLERPGPTRA